MVKSASVPKKRHSLPANAHGQLNSPDTLVRTPQARLWLRSSLRPRRNHHGAPKGRGRRTWQRCKPTMLQRRNQACLTESRSCGGSLRDFAFASWLTKSRASSDHLPPISQPNTTRRALPPRGRARCFPSGVVLAAELLHRGQHTGDVHSHPLLQETPGLRPLRVARHGTEEDRLPQPQSSCRRSSLAVGDRDQPRGR